MLEKLVDTMQIPGDKLAGWLMLKSFEFQRLHNINYQPGPNEFPWHYENVAIAYGYSALVVSAINHPIDAYQDLRSFIVSQKHPSIF